MNIFLLHTDPDEAAKALADKHANKMTLEAVQIANTGLHLAGASEHTFYRKTHKNHPWCKFAAKSFDHFQFVRERAHAIGREFLRRYGSRHTSHQKSLQNWDYDTLTAIEDILGRDDSLIWKDVPQAMPEQYHRENHPVEAYRDYYYNEKLPSSWFFYQKADPPDWFIEGTPLERWY